MPRPAACGPDASGIQGFGDGAAGCRAQRLNLADDGEHVRREGIRRRPVPVRAYGLRLSQIGAVAQDGALGFLRGQGSTGAVRDHDPLFLGLSGVGVDHERVRGRATPGHEARSPLGHRREDERHVPRQAARPRVYDQGLACRAAASCERGRGRDRLRPAGFSLVRISLDKLGLDGHPLGMRARLGRERLAWMPRRWRWCFACLPSGGRRTEFRRPDNGFNASIVEEMMAILPDIPGLGLVGVSDAQSWAKKYVSKGERRWSSEQFQPQF